MSSDPLGQLVCFVLVGGFLLVGSTAVSVVWNLTRPRRASIAWAVSVALACVAFCMTAMGQWMGSGVTLVLLGVAAINALAAARGAGSR